MYEMWNIYYQLACRHADLSLIIQSRAKEAERRGSERTREVWYDHLYFSIVKWSKCFYVSNRKEDVRSFEDFREGEKWSSNQRKVNTRQTDEIVLRNGLQSKSFSFVCFSLLNMMFQNCHDYCCSLLTSLAFGYSGTSLQENYFLRSSTWISSLIFHYYEIPCGEREED